jgi:hypothetical protein
MQNKNFFDFSGLTLNRMLVLVILTLCFFSVEFWVLSLLLKTPPFIKILLIAFSLGIFYGYKNLFIYLKKI